jgi:hypothetical protein
MNIDMHLGLSTGTKKPRGHPWPQKTLLGERDYWEMVTRCTCTFTLARAILLNFCMAHLLLEFISAKSLAHMLAFRNAPIPEKF